MNLKRKTNLIECHSTSPITYHLNGDIQMQTYIKTLNFTSENRAGSCLKLYIKSVAWLELGSNLPNPVPSQWEYKAILYLVSSMCFYVSLNYSGKRKGVYSCGQDMESGNSCRHHMKGVGKTRSSHSSLKNAIHTLYTRPR